MKALGLIFSILFFTLTALADGTTQSSYLPPRAGGGSATEGGCAACESIQQHNVPYLSSDKGVFRPHTANPKLKRNKKVPVNPEPVKTNN